MANPRSIYIIGCFEEAYVGSYFADACAELNIRAYTMSTDAAFRAGFLKRKFFWYFFGKRPTYLDQFSEQVVKDVQSKKPDMVFTTGLAPVNSAALKAIKKIGCKLVNYSTDDPFNFTNSGPWFLKAVTFYDFVFSCRRANIDELKKIGCPKVEYIAFGYDPRFHYVCDSFLKGDEEKYSCDVLFIGTADRDRIHYFETLINQGLNVHLYGGYWNRYPKLRKCFKGFANAEIGRKAVYYAKVCFGVLREANRDLSTMRSFEIPAMGGCFLVKDTEDHRELFGKDMEAVAYFSNEEDMVSQLKVLLPNKDLRDQMRARALELIHKGRHTYLDRLKQIIEKVYG